MICFIITVLIGFLLIKTFLKELKNIFVILSFSVALGISIEALLTFFLLLLCFKSYYFALGSVIIPLLIAILLAIKYKIRFFDIDKIQTKEKNILNYLFFLMLLINIIIISIHIYKEPEGWIDASIIWNLHSKFFYYIQESSIDWRVFYSNLPQWSHPDYPILLPLYNFKNQILNFGNYSGIIPLVTSLLFYISVITGLIGLVDELAGHRNALIAGIILMSTEPFVRFGVLQCADVPLSLYILCSVGALFLFDKYKNPFFCLFAFFFASSAAFCKNEGIAYFITFVLVTFIFLPNIKKRMAVIGCIFPVLCIILFKLFVCSKTDIFENQTFNIIISRLTDFSRIKLIVSSYMNNIYIIWNVFICTMFAIFTGVKKFNIYTLSAILISVGMFIIYFMIYMITPHNLNWHLDSSSIRLFLQFLPLFLLIIFITFNCAENR